MTTCLVGFANTRQQALLKNTIKTNEQLLTIPFYGIFLGEIKTINGSRSGTNSSPPSGIVAIKEVIKGNIETRDYDFEFQAPRRYSDYDQSEGNRLTIKKDWGNRILISPEVGTIFIGFAKFDSQVNKLRIAHDDMYIDSMQNRQVIEEFGGPGPRNSVLQISALIMIVLLPMISLALLRKVPKISLVLSLATFPLYIYYESGISPWANIRIDLFIVIPLLIASAVLAYMSLVKQANKKRNDAMGSE